MELNINISDDALKEKANDFIEKCNAANFVHAKEGGVLELDSLLVDFVGFINTKSE